MYKSPSRGSGPITSLSPEGRSGAGERDRAQAVPVARAEVALRPECEEAHTQWSAMASHL